MQIDVYENAPLKIERNAALFQIEDNHCALFLAPGVDKESMMQWAKICIQTNGLKHFSPQREAVKD